MSDDQRRQAQQKAVGVAACAAAFAVGGPLVSHSVETHKAGEEYRASVERLSVMLADKGVDGGIEAPAAAIQVADIQTGAPSTSAWAVPVSFDMAQSAVAQHRVKIEGLETRSLFAHASFTSSDLDRAGQAKTEMECLAEAVYYEARSEPSEGQMAVAEVVLNRVKDSRYPNTVCEVVFQGQYRTTGCQFTFTCDGARLVKPRGKYWEQARAVALHVSLGLTESRTGDATHYHTYYVDPYWAPGLVETAVIGSHIFYRFPNTRQEWTTARIALDARQKHRATLVKIEAEAGEVIADADTSVELEAPSGAAGAENLLLKVSDEAETLGSDKKPIEL